MTDGELMREVAAGSREAFEALFERHRRDVWRFFRRRLADAGGAEELVHDVFVVILQNAKRYEERAAFRSYLFGVAYKLLAAYRKKAPGGAVAFDIAEVEAASLDPDEGLWVRRAVASLDPDAREVLMLREYEGLSYQEIAHLLRIPLNTVRSRLFRARMDLKAALVGAAGRQMKVEHGSR
jgi:RNA polymerase sigma-70 factor (ECF subfamily)